MALTIVIPEGTLTVRRLREDRFALPPAGLFVSPGNAWLRLRSNETVRVGGTALVMGALGRPNAVCLPAAGTRIHRGGPLFSLQMNGRKATFRSPVDGSVTTCDVKLDGHPEASAEHALDDWAVEIRPDDLVALATPPGMEAPALADGGALMENALSHLRPEAWIVQRVYTALRLDTGELPRLEEPDAQRQL